MIAKAQCPMQHALDLYIIDKRTLTQDQTLGIIFGVIGPDMGVAVFEGNFIFILDSLGRTSDGIHDLLVAGATAQVRGERMGDFGPVGIRVFVDQGIRLHDKPGDAEAALHATAIDKRVGKHLLAILSQPFDRGDRGTLQLLHQGDA